jgi:hypothetical protein
MTRSLTQTNPFAARWIRPGAIPFLPPAGATWTSLCRQVAAHRRLQLLGPHGVGKSTLLAHFVQRLREQGWNVEHVAIEPHGLARVVAPVEEETNEAATAARHESQQRLLVIDGWQQLSAWRRLRLSWSSRRLLATTHADLGWQPLLQLQPDPELICTLSRHLQRNTERLVSDADARAAYERAAGNLREALFLLYDVYEARCQSC